jgi:hypothetical protein
MKKQEENLKRLAILKKINPQIDFSKFYSAEITGDEGNIVCGSWGCASETFIKRNAYQLV